MKQKKPSKSPPILVVDDDKDFLKSMEFTLLSNGITNVECCQDSQKVLPLLEKKKYSLILLDLRMPHISGEELLPKIVEKYPEIAVIVLTAYKEIATAVDCMKQGAFDYLEKPFDNSRLLEAVRNGLDIDFLLRKGKAQSVIARVAPVIEAKRINKDNVDLFYALGLAYEKIEDFVKAADLYRDIAKFDPGYPGIQKKLKKIEKLKDDIIKIYHKDRYEIKEKIGEGGIGIVYKAKDARLERMVALKILNQSPIPGKRDIERFISEAKRVAKLHHTNIVGVYDFGQLENNYFISMEFIEGINLGTLISNKHPIPIPDILIIAKKLFTALAHSHRNGVIHRDIKPSNIMITYENEVKVVDFGIAVLRDELKIEDRYEILGSPSFMSPEQIKNSTTDHRTDIYSAGVTLFHLVTGKIPYEGTIEQIFSKHLHDPVPLIAEYRSDTPVGLIQIIEKCMEKNEDDRYQSSDRVLEEIDGIRDSSGKVFITDQTKLKVLELAEVTTIISDEDTQPKSVSLRAEPFIQVLQNEDLTIRIREEAVQVLAEIGGDKAVKALKKALRDPNKELVDAVQKILEQKEDSQRVNRRSEPFIQVLQNKDLTIRIRKVALQELAEMGGDTAVKALKKTITNGNKELVKTALDALKHMGKLEFLDAQFVDDIDIPTFAYHLVFSRYASPELLTEFNHADVKKAIQKIYPEDKGTENLITTLQAFEDEHSNQNPNPLWHSWITETQNEKIKDIKEMLERMINP